MRITLATVNVIAKLAIEAANEAGVAFYREADAIPLEDNMAVDGLSFNHVPQLSVIPYDRLSKDAPREIVNHFTVEWKNDMGPLVRSSTASGPFPPAFESPS